MKLHLSGDECAKRTPDDVAVFKQLGCSSSRADFAVRWNAAETNGGTAPYIGRRKSSAVYFGMCHLLSW
jgi:hypothetical protein